MTQPAQPLFTFTQKSAKQIHDDYIRTLKNGLIGILKVPLPNVGPGSDYDLQGWAIGNTLAVVQANAVILADQVMPDTAGGASLDRWLALVNLSRRAATQSQGLVLPLYSLAQGFTNIPANTRLVDSAGLQYQVAVSGSYGPGNPPGTPANLYVPVISVDAGAATDHQNGDVLRWVTAPAFCGDQVTVGTSGGTDGLSGGNDSEAGQDEPPRARLFSVFQNPPASGNWSDVAQWAQQSTPDVQAAGVYPALLGPATVFVAVWQAPQLSAPLGSTSKNRNVPTPVINGTVLPFVQGQVPANMFACVASVANQVVDVALLLSLPAAPTAFPAGPGGGWLDGSPWPTTVGGTAPCKVTAVASSTQFTVNAPTAPTPGVSRIAYISPSNWQLYTATVLSFTGFSGAYLITIDTPWSNIISDFTNFGVPAGGNGPAVFPQALQQQNYLTAILAAFAQMGPGEWSANSFVLSRAFRHPTPGSSKTWPYSLDANFLRVMENAGPEVLTAAYAFRSAITPTVPASITVNVSTGQLTSAPPNIFVPRNLAWYAQ